MLKSLSGYKPVQTGLFLRYAHWKAGAALTAYGVYYNYNFVTNYLYGRGETIGSGDIFYTQVGYLLSSQHVSDRIQPYFIFSNHYFDQFRKESAS